MEVDAGRPKTRGDAQRGPVKPKRSKRGGTRGPRGEAQRGPVRPGLVDGRGREAAAGRAGNGCKLQINRRLDQNILRGANDAL